MLLRGGVVDKVKQGEEDKGMETHEIAKKEGSRVLGGEEEARGTQGDALHPGQFVVLLRLLALAKYRERVHPAQWRVED